MPKRVHILLGLVAAVFLVVLASRWGPEFEPSTPTSTPVSAGPSAAGDRTRDGRSRSSAEEPDKLPLMQAEWAAGRWGRCLQLASEIDLHDLDQVWEWLDDVEDQLRTEGKNVGYANELRIRVLWKASFLGETDRAIRLVTASSGPGSQRTALIPVVFQASSLPVQTLVEIAQQLDHGDERAAAFLGIGSRIAKLDSLADGGDWDTLVSVPGGIDAVRKGLSDYPVTGIDRSSAERTARIQEAMTAAQSLVSEGAMPTQLLSEVVAEIGRNLPFETWELLHSQSSPLLEDAAVLANLLQGMSRDDPIRALELVVGHGDLPEQSIQAAMTSALQRDVTVAAEWYETNAANLPQSQRDYLNSAFAIEGAAHQEVETAWNWVAQIEDPHIRRAAEGRVWQAELGQVQRAARESPQATIDAIVSGDSPHATYWIETAMTEWMSADAEAAQEWYDAHRNSLTPEQNEPVALAYARRAISQGDLDTATQWAQQVISEKHKAKIEAELAAAKTDAP